MKLPNEESLPAWFLERVAERESIGRSEGAFRWRRVLSSAYASICVAGPTWAFASPVSDGLADCVDITDPLFRVWPGLPFAADHPGLTMAAGRSAQAGLVVPFGREVYIQAPLYELVVGAFGIAVEWWCGAPNHVVVARMDGEVVAALAPCFARGRDHLDRWYDEAERERAARGGVP